MLKFKVNGKKGEVVVTLPTSVKELTPEYLGDITDEIVVADNYSLIALCHKEKLSSFVLAGRNKKNQMNTSVVPIFVKRGYTQDKSFQPFIEVGDKLLISPTAMSLGLHVNVPMNTLTMGSFVDIMDGDNTLYQRAIQHNEDVFFIEFKLIPNNEIIGAYKPKLRKSFDNPFAYKNPKGELEAGVF